MIRQTLDQEIDRKRSRQKPIWLQERRINFASSEFNQKHNREKWNVLITLDVQKPFTTASWNLILDKREWRKILPYLINIICGYLKERTIQVNKTDILNIQAGIPQESVLEPTLGNILYNDFLEITL